MKPMPLSELTAAMQADLIGSACDCPAVTGVSTDSRAVEPGDCFFAISGPNFDGHDYLASAFEKGAACAVVSKDTSDPQLSGKPLLKVGDTVGALGRLAAHYRLANDFKVVAMTGSVGKTTVRQITCHVLSTRYRVHQSPRNFNNDIGLPFTLLTAEADHEIIVAEIGANAPGEIACLTNIARPDIALVNNVYPAHLEGFGSLENIAREKLSIAEGLTDDGRFIINGDIANLADICNANGVKFETFGISEACNYRADNVEHDGASSRFRLLDSLAGSSAQVSLPLAGPGNVANAMAAYSICRSFGITPDDFAEAVAGLSPVAMRAELLRIGTLQVLSDCYNANPASMANALETLKALNRKGGRAVFICGDMAELGEQGPDLHRQLGLQIAHSGIDLLITTGPLSEVAARSAADHSDRDIAVKCCRDTISACNNLKDFIKDGDIVLVKGSRSARLELAVEELKEIFSPRVSA